MHSVFSSSILLLLTPQRVRDIKDKTKKLKRTYGEHVVVGSFFGGIATVNYCSLIETTRCCL